MTTMTATTTTSTRRYVGRATAVIIAFAVALAVACSVNVDVANKACDPSGACGFGYVCDDLRTPKTCVLPQDRLVADASSGGVITPACDPCPCTTDPDCKDPQRPRCSPSSKTCVECTTTPTDNCRAGQYCNDQFQCILGCKQESDCSISPASPHCEATRHQCVECTTAFPCTDITKTCSPSGSCVESCATNPTCANGRQCCSGLCLDLTKDILNCGACDKRCESANGTAKCVNSACESDCANGFANCDPVANGCETNIRTLAHCGSCTTNCDKVKNTVGLTCVTGTCNFTACAVGFRDGDGDKTNGCEEACGKLTQPCCPNDTCSEGTCKPPNPPSCR